MMGFFVVVFCSPVFGTLKYTITQRLRYKLSTYCSSSAEEVQRLAVKFGLTDLRTYWPMLCPDFTCNNAVSSAKCDGASSRFVTVTLVTTSVPWVSVSLNFCLPFVFLSSFLFFLCLCHWIFLCLCLSLSLFLSIFVFLYFYFCLSLFLSCSLLPSSQQMGYLDLSVS